MNEAKPLDGKIALVTGASRGIGYEIALGLGRAGAHVIALARTKGGLEELDDALGEFDATATLVPLDLRDYDALDLLGATIHERWGKLDIFVGNAGLLGMVTPLHQLKPGVFEDIFAINVTANYRLLRSLDPLLRAADESETLFLTSGAVRSLRPFVGPYAASKAALEALAICYARENQKGALRVNLFDPGVARTGMRAQYAPGEDPATVPHPADVASALVQLVADGTGRTGELYSFPESDWVER